jgi:hypothetical protein
MDGRLEEWKDGWFYGWKSGFSQASILPLFQSSTLPLLNFLMKLLKSVLIFGSHFPGLSGEWR